jgi:tetratricopeptide (TPR) repeat protein
MSEKAKRKELKAPDALQKVGADAVPLLIQHQKNIVIAVVVLVAIGGGVTFAQYLGGRGETKAAEQLGAALKPLAREVNEKPVAETPEGQDPPFKSQAEKEEAIIKSLTDFRKDHQGSRAAAQAGLPLGQALLRQGKFAEAAPLFDEYLKVSSLDDPLRPTALEAKGYALEGKKEFEAAFAAFEQLAKETKGDFMKGMGQYHKARILSLQGKNDDAVRGYQEVIAEAANTSASRLAADRISMLAAQGVAIPAAPVKKPDAG